MLDVLYIGQTSVQESGSPSLSTSVERKVYKANGALLYDNTWYSSLTKAGKESNIVRALMAGVRFTVVPPAVGGGKAKGVRLFGQVLAGGECTHRHGRPSSLGERGDKQGDQHTDDRDDHEHLDEREGKFAGFR